MVKGAADCRINPEGRSPQSCIGVMQLDLTDEQATGARDVRCGA
jgi:hypothetical protein